MEEGFPEIFDAEPELIAHRYQEADNVAQVARYVSIVGDRALSRSALKEHTSRSRGHLLRLLVGVYGDAMAAQRSSLPPNVLPKHFVPSNLYQPALASGPFALAPALHIDVHVSRWVRDRSSLRKSPL
jgi:hypothetical protein